MQEPAKVRLIENEDVIQALAANGPMSRSTKGFCQGDRGVIRTSSS
jgi:hypothetical protein